MDKKFSLKQILIFIIISNLIIGSIPYISSIKGQVITDKTSNEKIQIKIAVAGDTIMAKEVIESAKYLINTSITDPYLRVASGFEGLFSNEVKENISSADIAFCNLETPLAEGLTKEWYWDDNNRPMCKKIELEPDILSDGEAYTYGVEIRSTNTHPAFAYALKQIGFDIVSTANNHYNNRGSNGIDASIDSLRKANLDFIGTLRYDEIIDDDNDAYPDNIPYIIKEVKGIKIAFLAITSEIDPFSYKPIILPFHIGKLCPADNICSRQIYYLSSNNSPIEYNLKNFCNGIEKAKKHSDIVVVSAHFGIYKRHEPSCLQKKLAKHFLESGADIIVGHGTHVLQQINTYITSDGRKTYIINNLGNFIFRGGNEQDNFNNQIVSIIGFVNIIKNGSGNILIDNISYIPIFSFENQENITSVIVVDGLDFEKTKKMIQIIFNGSKIDHLILTYNHLKENNKFLTYISDSFLEYIIFKRWKLHK